MRPYQHQFPLDAIHESAHLFGESLKDPRQVIVVATDKYDADESSKTSAVIPDEIKDVDVTAGEDVIVGIGMWTLEEGSKRIGTFHKDNGWY